MKQKLFTLLLAVAASIGTIFAESGVCGENLTWDLTNGVLTISGSGEMFDYSFKDYAKAPWYSNKDYISQLIIANGVTSIGSNAFESLYSLTSVNIPNSVTSIGGDAFYYCRSLTSIEIPNSVISVGSNAFESCTGLASLTIPNSIISIGYGAFADCSGLTSIEIPNSVTSIGTYAFKNCISLKSIEIPNSVKNIGNNAFYECTGLTSVNIPNSVTSIGESVFSGCSSLPVENNLRYADTYLVEAVDKTLSSYTIKEGTRWIGTSSFRYCDNLTSAGIPNSVASIGNYAFAYCTGLTSVTIPNGVTSIGEKAFCDCSNLVSINIPNSATRIKESTFSGCSSLISLTIPNSIKTIEDEAFRKCTGIISIEIPNSVINVGSSAFESCSSLRSVTCYAETPIELRNNVWEDVDCSKISLYVLEGSVEAYKSADQWKEFNPILPITAKDTETNTVKAEPTETSVEVAWPSVSGAYTYELVIKDKSGNVICTLVFNAQGQLLSIAFNAPANGKAPQQTQSAGFSFTVTGLDEGTNYDLTITAKGENGNELDKKNVTFHTNGSTGIENIVVDEQKANKILHDGQIYILRGDHIFDAQGKIVR